MLRQLFLEVGSCLWVVKTKQPSKHSLDGEISCILGCFPRGGTAPSLDHSSQRHELCLLVMESREQRPSMPTSPQTPRVLQTSVQANKRTATSGDL